MKKWLPVSVMLIIALFASVAPLVAGTPVISNLSPHNVTEQDEAVVIDSDAGLSNGGHYVGGYLMFALGDSTSQDTLDLQEDASVSTEAGVLSIVDDVVYVGDGSQAVENGSVDGEYDGVIGQKFRINFSDDFPTVFENGRFNDGTAGDTTITGWTIVNEQIKFQPSATTIAGYPTPTDTDVPSNAPNSDQNTPATLGTLATVLSADTNDGDGLSVQMSSTGMTTSAPYDVVRGPYVYSTNTVSISAGDFVSFEWKAEGGGDAYDVYGYIVNTDSHIETILDETGDSDTAETDWATEMLTVAEAGDYHFVFVSGTYDFSGGQAAGAQLFIDNVKVIRSVGTPTDAVATQLIRRVTFQNTSDDPPAAKRTLSVEAQSGDGLIGENDLFITISPVNDAPTDIAISNTDIGIDCRTSGVVGTLSSTDPDSSDFSYTLVDGAGSGGNTFFDTSGDALTIVGNDMAPGAYSVRIESDDGDGRIHEQSLALTVMDTDSDGLSDIREGDEDTDSDGTPDYQDTDSDNDGIADLLEGDLDSDDDGIPDYLDTDGDGDGLLDRDEGIGDTDGDGIPDYLDTDGDGDGISDTEEGGGDTDGDGIPDYKDSESDGDGVSDAVENRAANGGDGNNDGIADRLQANVTTLMDASETVCVTLASPEGTTLMDVAVTENPSLEDMPENSALSHGLFTFTVTDVEPGGGVSLTFVLPEGARPDSYLKYGPTPDNAEDHWYEFVYDGLAGAEIDGNLITLHLVDGSEGDADLTADGTITDPGGPMLDTGDVAGGGGCFVGAVMDNDWLRGFLRDLTIGALTALFTVAVLWLIKTIWRLLAIPKNDAN